MLTMTPRERFACIMAHQEADRTPIDLAGTSLTALDDVIWPSLRAALGLPPRDPAAQHADPRPYDEEVLVALDVDFRRVGDLVGSGDRPAPGRPDRRIDIWGITRAFTGQYWDIVESPLRGATLDDLAAFPWPDPAALLPDEKLEAFAAEARRLWETTDYVVVGEHPVFGVLELACWMCGFDDFLYRLAGDRPFVTAIFEKLLALQKALIEPYYKAIGPYIHLTTSGDDFGTQTGPFMAPATFRSQIKPYFAERIAFTRQFTAAHFWHHTCGSVYDLLPDLIEAGVEILNPVQPKARRMEPARLKAAYGDRVCFHGGFDTQDVLPFGAPEEIEAEVRRVMDALKPGGGYIFSAAHNIQRDVPAQNIVAMYRAAHRLGRYDEGEQRISG